MCMVDLRTILNFYYPKPFMQAQKFFCHVAAQINPSVGQWVFSFQPTRKPKGLYRHIVEYWDPTGFPYAFQGLGFRV